MNVFTSKRTQRLINFSLAALLMVSTLTASVPFLFSQKAHAAGPTTVLSTSLSGWSTSDTRAQGHHETVSGALHVWTESNTSLDKVAGYYSTPGMTLNDIPSASIDFSSFIGGRPGLQISVDRDGNGTTDGNLVYEPWAYGEGEWWTNKDGFGVPAGMGYPSFGTLADFQAANPDAKVTAVGFSLGSGVKGDDTITKMTFGNLTFTFNTAPLAAATNLNMLNGASGYSTIPAGVLSNGIASSSTDLNWTAPTGTVDHYLVQAYKNNIAVGTQSWVGTPNSWVQVGNYGDGSYTYGVTAYDASGVAGAIATSATYIWDHTAPVVTVTPVAGSLLHGTESFNISVADANFDVAASHVYVSLYNNGGTQKRKGATVDLSSGHATFTVDTTKLDDGLATFNVGRFADAAGNFTGTIDTYFKNYQIDNTIPNAPTGLFFSADDTTLTNLTVNSVLNNKIVLGWTDPTNSPSEITQHITQVDGPNGYTNQFWNGYPNTWLNINGGEFGQHGNGAYTYKVKAENAAGTWSDWSTPLTLIYDNVAPTATINGYAPVALYGAGTDIDVHAIDANYLQTDLYLNGATTPFKTYTGTDFGLFWLVDGNYRMVVRDNATNLKEYDFTIDKIAPDAPIVSATGLTSGKATNQGSVNILWTQPSTDTVKYDYKVWTNITGDAYNGVGNAYAANGLTGNSRSGTFTEGEGTYFVQVRAIDAAGNPSLWSNTFSVTYDKTGPAVNVDANTFTSNQPTVTGTVGSDADHVNIVILDADGNTVAFGPALYASGNTAWSYAVQTSLPNGKYTVFARAYDALKNPKDNSAIVTVAVVAPVAPATTPTTTTTVTPSTTPIITPASAAAVLGATTDNTPTTDTAVQGATDTNAATAVHSAANKGTIFGLAWFWWILILAALAAIAWYITAAIRRRNEA